MQTILWNSEVLSNILDLINKTVYSLISKGNNTIKAISIEIWISILHYFFENQDDMYGLEIIRCFPNMIKISTGLFEYISITDSQDLTLLSSCSNLLFWIIQLIDDGMAIQIIKMIKGYLLDTNSDNIKIGLLILHSTFHAFK